MNVWLWVCGWFLTVVGSIVGGLFIVVKSLGSSVFKIQESRIKALENKVEYGEKEAQGRHTEIMEAIYQVNMKISEHFATTADLEKSENRIVKRLDIIEKRVFKQYDDK